MKVFAVKGRSPESGKWYIPRLGEEGQMAVFYSEEDARSWAVQWERECQDVSCLINGIKIAPFKMVSR